MACGPKAPPPVVLSGPDDVTEEALNALVRELVPLVEEAAGRPFVDVPHARLGVPRDLAGILESEFLSVMGATYDAPDWVLERMASSVGTGAAGLIGKYGIETRVLYLAPAAVSGVVAGTDLRPDQYGDVVRLVMAHEMVHALQDQQARHGAVWHGLRDREAINGMRGVTEGHANFAERRVAGALGLESVVAHLDASQGWDDDGPRHPGAFGLWAVYGQGRHFVQHHYDAGGMDAVWTLLEHPPPTTTMLFRPETYASEVEVGPDYRDALAGVEEELTTGRWITVHSLMGEMDLREEAFWPDTSELDEVLGHLRYGYLKEAHRDDRQAQVRVLTFDGPEWPGRYLDLWSTQAEVATRWAASLGVPWAADVSPYEHAGGRRAIEVVVSPPGAHSAQHEQRAVWIADGDRVLVVKAEQFRPGIRMERAVARLLEQLGDPSDQ